MAHASIKPQDNGPLMASGIARCRDSRGQSITAAETVFLCRCGGSRNKPFCDGTHKKIGFSDARESIGPHGPTADYTGREITIHDNRSVCAHIGHCTERSPDVFSLKRTPWIDPDGAPVAQAAATVSSCPSGALSYTTRRQGRRPDAAAPEIEVLKDGPYAVRGGAVLEFDPPPLDPQHYTLCRCGASRNKPFCDGSHWRVGFKAD